jgi:hypothetical protein
MRAVLTVHLLPMVLQVLLPLLLLYWQWRGESNRLLWMVKTTTVGVYLVAVLLAGLWLVLPWYTPLLYLVAFVMLATRRRWPPVWRPAGLRGWTSVAVVIVAAVGSIVLLSGIIAARRPPTRELPDFRFPLEHGTYHVVAGGGGVLINPHLGVLKLPAARSYRGQSYGIDIVKLGPLGLRADGFAPPDLIRYAIFGATVVAPCDGVVLLIEDGNPDMPPTRRDREHMAGNYVFLECGDYQVLLGHLHRGSVLLQPGDRVEMGDPLGQVGNSGNTDEPHLHVHVQRPAAPGEYFLAGTPVPASFNGHFPVRNDRITVE